MVVIVVSEGGLERFKINGYNKYSSIKTKAKKIRLHLAERIRKILKDRNLSCGGRG